jgi:hypothetical protein
MLREQNIKQKQLEEQVKAMNVSHVGHILSDPGSAFSLPRSKVGKVRQAEEFLIID